MYLLMLMNLEVSWQVTEVLAELLSFLLNQARAGQRLAHAWFVKIAFVREVGMSLCVCVRPRRYKLHSYDIEPVQPAEQVCCIWKCNKAFYAAQAFPL